MKLTGPTNYWRQTSDGYIYRESKVGIETAMPSYDFDVNGDLGASGNTAINPPYMYLGVFSTAVSSNSAHINVMPATINTSAISATGGSTQWASLWYVFQSH